MNVALTAAAGFGVLGAVVGGAFALALAVAGRRLSFAQLTPSRVAATGVLGGLGVAAALLLGRIIVIGPPERPFLPDFMIAATLGGTTAWLMLRLARRAPDVPLVDALTSGDQWAPDAVRASREKACARPT
jgi:cell division protein FtsX